MWRALFLALGISLSILGGECLVVDSFVMAAEKAPAPASQSPATLFGAGPAPIISSRKEVHPAEWAPWSFLSAGAVVILYSLTINRP